MKKTARRKAPATFITKDFLLESPFARQLYHEHAADLPIIDYHNHLPPQEIAEDRRFANLSQVWLAGDHYKWRAMRTNGVAERDITGDASDEVKFQRWAATVPYTLRNPLYHWTHLELLNPFGVKVLLNADTASQVWEACNRKLARADFSVRGLLAKARVEVVCTTDDPTDDLRWHRALAAKPAPGLQMFPAFRPDPALGLDQPAAWNAWMDRLGQAAGVAVRDWSSLLAALRQRVTFFHACGGRLSDHGLEQAYADDTTPEQAAAIFQRARNGEAVPEAEVRGFRSALLFELGLLYAEHGWTQQFHLGALRNVNAGLMNQLGRDCGCDIIVDFDQARPLARMLDRWNRQGQLAKTIVYNLNPRDNEVMAALCGAFQDGSAPGKIQYGSAWWFLDQLDGMEKQLESLSNLGLLRRFVGMLTDSRSFLSFSRHAYFRRILCNVLGRDVQRGRLPRDPALLGQLVREVCHDNAARYFGFPTTNSKRNKT